ncbi:MAG: hypothetical protein EPO24_14655 [Bacteroidetes bacterium]|nr:MAG: hypothetical protein EPO24_14655 [Bacteroidota bacterium]
MKNFIIVITVLLLVTMSGYAQFKSNADPSVSQSLVHPSGSINSFLGFLNPDNFLMRHNVSLSYMSLGGSSLSLASYTNSMFYKISDPLNMRVDLTLQGSPFGSSNLMTTDNLNKVFISRAELNYKPSDNFYLQLQYRELPMNYWGAYPYSAYSPYSPFWGDR